MSYWDAVFAFLVAMVIATVLTPLAARLARRIGATAKPTERGLAQKETPQLGGLAILIGVLVAAAIWLPDTIHLPRTVGALKGTGGTVHTWWVAAGACLIALVGATDDALDLSPAVKLGGQIAAAVLAIAFVLTAIKLHLWTSKHVAGALIVAVACAALAVALARRPPMRAVLAGAGALLVALVIAGYPWQRHYLKGRYAFQPGISALSHVWALFRGVHHARVAVAGTFGMFFAYPLYGLDDSNRVQYIAARGPHGSFTPIASCRAWRAAVDAGNYRYVVTTPARDPWHPKPLRFSPERSWIASDPAARIVYEHRAFGQLIDVFALSGPLLPDGCPARPTA